MGVREAVRVAPTDAELERAIAYVTGVAEATVARSATDGRNRLRVRLYGGEDPEQVAWSITATLHERFGITLDPAAIRLVSGPDEDAMGASGQERGPGGGGIHLVTARTRVEDLRAAATVPDAHGADRDLATGQPSGTREAFARVVARHLEVERVDGEVRVTATLEHLGRISHGTAATVATRQGTHRAVAEATVSALRHHTVVGLLVSIDRVEVRSGGVTVVLSLVADQGEEALIGSSLLRGDPDRAVMCATLNALNRRVALLLPAETASVS